jgi:ketosteroid isomerase-like protein
MALDAETASSFAALKQQFAENFKNRDLAAAVTIYADDAILLPPGTTAIRGRADIEAFWQRLSQVQEIEFGSESIEPLGAQAACEIGVMRMSLGSARGQARDVHNKYLFLWRKAGADWKLATCIWNRLAEEQPSGGRAAGRAGPGGMRGGGRGRRTAAMPRAR